MEISHMKYLKIKSLSKPLVLLNIIQIIYFVYIFKVLVIKNIF